jgi:mRNA interferase MazF
LKRGDVFWAELEPRSGSEQRGRRPVVVISNDGFNQITGWRSVIVVPLTTSAAQTARGPTAIPLPRGAAGIRKESLALCHQVTTLDRGKLVQRLGALSPEQLLRIAEGLKAAMEIE